MTGEEGAVYVRFGPGLTQVMLPARNRRDFDEIPQGARDRLEFVWLEQVDDAMAGALEKSAQATVATG